MQLKYPCRFLIYYWAEVLTLNLQVFLCLEVLDCGVVHDASHWYTIVVLGNSERQPAGYCVHLVVGQLNLGLAYGKYQTQEDLNAGIHVHLGLQLK